MPSGDLDFNPYAAPKTAVTQKGGIGETAGSDYVWREGKLLALRHSAIPPRRCIKCNGDADGAPYVKKLSWHHPGWYFLLLLRLLSYIIAYFFVRHRGVVEISLCGRHRKRRGTMIAIAWGLGLLGLGVIIFALAYFPDQEQLDPMEDSFMTGGVVLAFIGLILGHLGSRLVWPKRIDPSMLWLKGAGASYLAALNPPGPAYEKLNFDPELR